MRYRVDYCNTSREQMPFQCISARKYLHNTDIHAHIFWADNVLLAVQNWQCETGVISWRTSAQSVYIGPIQDQEVNLISKLHKRAKFLFNRFINEQRARRASWKSILWVLSGASRVLISLFLSWLGTAADIRLWHPFPLWTSCLFTLHCVKMWCFIPWNLFLFYKGYISFSYMSYI